MNTDPSQIFIDEYDYELPNNRIAYVPLANRDDSRLLVVKSGSIEDESFKNLPALLPEHTRLFLNNTKVIEARLFFKKDTGGIIEIFCLEPHEPKDITTALQQKGTVQWQCLIGGASKWKHGLILTKELEIGNEKISLQARYTAKLTDSFVVSFTWNSEHNFAEILHASGAIPLPPYIKRDADAQDTERYQTVFAKHDGSVAAPTAALHFSPQIFEALAEKNILPSYLTLHVGAGTFKPVKTDTIAAHEMHGENFSVTKNLLQELLDARIRVAVGTTSLRSLESLYWLGVKLLTGKIVENQFELGQWEGYELEAGDISYDTSINALLNYLKNNNKDLLWCRTSLLIMPGYQFRSVQGLITNFHQPRSTLLLLVAAFIGAKWKEVYQHALNHGYRFLSYGDSSLLWRSEAD